MRTLFPGPQHTTVPGQDIPSPSMIAYSLAPASGNIEKSCPFMLAVCHYFPIIEFVVARPGLEDEFYDSC